MQPNFSPTLHDRSGLLRECFDAVAWQEPSDLVTDPMFLEEFEETWYTNVGAEDAGGVISKSVLRVVAGTEVAADRIEVDGETNMKTSTGWRIF
jgi:hypothetical protein